MDTVSFLSLVMPGGGHYFAAELKKNGMAHHHAGNISDLAEKISFRKSKSENNIYFAMASYKQASYQSEQGKVKARTQENVDKLRCFWIDLDCKGKITDYADQKSAAIDIKKFSADSGIGLPTAVVNSGYGLHAYWVMDQDMGHDQWTSIAKRWRSTLDRHGVKHDSSCTTDSARILRPVGTLNYKPGNAPMEVKHIGGSGAVFNIDEFSSKLDAGEPTTTLPTFGRLPGVDMSLNEAAETGTEHSPSSIKEIVKECSLTRAVGELRGNVSEPLWHKMLGLVKHTVEGAKAIHVFSCGHPSYTAQETEEKAAAWVVGPTSCEVLDRESKELPGHCVNCKHRGSITSPIQLGRVRVAIIEKTLVQEGGVLVEKDVEIPALPKCMDEKFRWHNGALERNAPDVNGKFTWTSFCAFHLHPFSYYDDEEGKHIMLWRLREREGIFKEFELTGGAMGAGGALLHKELGQNGVVSIHGRKAHMEAYLTTWFNDTKKNKVGTETYLHYGWHGDDFLLGDTMIKKDGEKQQVRLGGDAEKIRKHFHPKGTLEQWKSLVDRAYNRPGQEQYQFMMGVGFGSPLVKLFNVSGGVVFSAVSYDSGQGKSTAGQVAAGIYACGKGGGAGITLTKQQATHKAVFAMAGVLHSIPLMVDELTNTKAEEASDIVYTFSQGSARVGLTQDGRLNYNRHGWAGNMIQTSNKPLTGIITGAKPGADAELARLVEFTFDNVSSLSKAEADDIFSELIECYGHAGMEYMSYVVTHQAEVLTLIKKVQQMIDEKTRMTRKDRYWSVGITSAIVGLLIAKKVGLVQFDISSVVAWISSKVVDMRKEIGSTTSSPEECFTLMMTDLAPGLIITDIEGDKRNSNTYPVIIREPRAPYTGRVIADSSIGYVVQSAILAWCAKNQVSMRAMLRAATDKGWVKDAEPVVRYPAKGTPFTMGQSRCYVIDWSKLENSLAADPHMARVVSLMGKKQ